MGPETGRERPMRQRWRRGWRGWRRRRPKQQRQQQEQQQHSYRRRRRRRLRPLRSPRQRPGKQQQQKATETKTFSLSLPPPCRLGQHLPKQQRFPSTPPNHLLLLSAPCCSPRPRARRPPALPAREGTSPLSPRPRVAAWPAEEEAAAGTRRRGGGGRWRRQEVETEAVATEAL